MITDSYITDATRALFISFPLFNPSLNLWIVVDALIEFSVTGSIFPTYLYTRPFRPNMIETDIDKFVQGLEVFKAILLLYVVFLILIKICGKGFEKLFSPRTFFAVAPELTVLSLAIGSLVLSYTVSRESTQDILNSTEYTDLTNKSFWFEEIFIFNAVSLLVIFYKIVTTLRIARYIHQFITTFEVVSTPGS